jgi:hypothetical protein
MGDEEHRDAQALLQVAHFLSQALAQVLVEAREGLVEEEYLGFEYERPGERHALLLPARELVGGAVAIARQPT